MSVTLPNSGKTRAIFDLSEATKGKTVCDVVVENDSIAITCYVTSLGSDQTLDVLIEEIGNDPRNVKLIHRFPQVARSRGNPQSVSLPVGGVLRFTAEYSGAVDFEMRARAISGGALVQGSTQLISSVESDDDKVYREQIICLLTENNVLLGTILNHQRLITNINQDLGDVY